MLDGLSPIGISIPPQNDAETTFGEKNKLFISTYSSGRAPSVSQLQLLTPCGYHTLYVGFAIGFSGNSWWLLPSSFYAVLCLENVNTAHWNQMLLPQQLKGALNLIQILLFWEFSCLNLRQHCCHQLFLSIWNPQENESDKQLPKMYNYDLSVN